MNSRALPSRRCLLGLFTAFIIGVLPACSGQAGDGSLKGKVTSSGPLGIFYMNKYWIASHSLEQAAWYFTSDGHVYENPQTGLTDADLAAHKGRQGTFKLNGKDLEVTWADGKGVTKAPFEPDKSGISFAWDTGLFTGAPPITDNQQVVGKFEGGSSIALGSGGINTSNTFEFRADGTYGRVGIASAQSTSNQSTLSSGGQSSTDGTWKADAYTITLTAKDGTATRHFAFPYFENVGDAVNSRLYFSGLLLKRLKP